MTKTVNTASYTMDLFILHLFYSTLLFRKNTTYLRTGCLRTKSGFCWLATERRYRTRCNTGLDFSPATQPVRPAYSLAKTQTEIYTSASRLAISFVYVVRTFKRVSMGLSSSGKRPEF